jgi:hypothetical protein
MVQFGVQSQITSLRENTTALKDLIKNHEKTHNLLQATIRAASEQAHENDLRAQRLHDSIKALKNEVRLRHGILDIEEVTMAFSSSSGAGGGSSSRAPASRPSARPMTRQQQLRAVTRTADERIQMAKRDVTADFEKDVQVKLKQLPKKRK